MDNHLQEQNQRRPLSSEKLKFGYHFLCGHFCDLILCKWGRFIRSNGLWYLFAIASCTANFVMLHGFALLKVNLNSADGVVFAFLVVTSFSWIAFPFLDRMRDYARLAHKYLIMEVLGSIFVIFVAVGYHLNVDLTMLELITQLVISFYCLCVFRLLDGHLDYGLIEYMAINPIERVSGIHGFRWQF